MMKATEKMVPELRFKEFEDKYSEKHFGDIYSFHSTNSLSRDKLNYVEGEVYNIHYGDIHTKFTSVFDISNENVPFINSDIDIRKVKEDSYCKVGDIVMADASEDYNDIGKSIEIVNLDNRKVLAGLHTFLARPSKGKIGLGYINYLLRSWGLRKQIMTIAQGTKVLSLSTSRVSELKINIPSLPEQEKIAAFLYAVDQKISQLSRKKELLSQYKKGMMQKLFSQEIRFKPDNGQDFPDWEEKKLGEVATFLKGKGISKSDISENGNQPCIRYGELYTVYGETIIDVFSSTNVASTELILSKSGDVIIPSSGETNIDIAKASCVMKSNIALGGDLNIFRGNFNGVFLSYYLNNAYKIEIAKLAQGNSVVHLYSNQLKSLLIKLPSIIEQQKIANYLSALDAKIGGVEQQISQAQRFKKGLLQKMFV